MDAIGKELEANRAILDEGIQDEAFILGALGTECSGAHTRASKTGINV